MALLVRVFANSIVRSIVVAIAEEGVGRQKCVVVLRPMAKSGALLEATGPFGWTVQGNQRKIISNAVHVAVGCVPIGEEIANGADNFETSYLKSCLFLSWFLHQGGGEQRQTISQSPYSRMFRRFAVFSPLFSLEGVPLQTHCRVFENAGFDLNAACILESVPLGHNASPFHKQRHSRGTKISDPARMHVWNMRVLDGRR